MVCVWKNCKTCKKPLTLGEENGILYFGTNVPINCVLHILQAALCLNTVLQINCV